MTLTCGLSRSAALFFGLLILGAAVGTTEAYTPTLYSFGDSLSDVGENNYLSNPLAPRANFPPYGETFPLYPSGRFSNGRLVIDFLSQYLGLVYSVPYLSIPAGPFMYVVPSISFASAGSGILDSTFAFEGVDNLNAQVAQFQNMVKTLNNEVGSYFANYLVNNAIVTFSTGNNDILFYLKNPALQAQLIPEVYVEVLIYYYKQAINTVIASGARKIVVSGLAPIGCTPTSVGSGTTGACLDSVNGIAQNFNAQLLNAVNQINAGGVAKVSFGNPYNFVLNLVQNQQGFTHGSTACCGSGSFNGNFGGYGVGSYNVCSSLNLNQYLFWDYLHLTERAYGLVAQQFWTGDTSFIQPTNAFQLSLLNF